MANDNIKKVTWYYAENGEVRTFVKENTTPADVMEVLKELPQALPISGSIVFMPNENEKVQSLRLGGMLSVEQIH